VENIFYDTQQLTCWSVFTFTTWPIL